MPDAEVRIHGWDELISGSQELAGKIEDQASRRFDGVADHVAADVAAAVPVETGALAGSVTAELHDDAVAVGIGGDDVPYAGWIEFGGDREGKHGAIASRPYVETGRYLFPTALDAEPQLIAAGTDAASDEIGRYRWESPKT